MIEPVELTIDGQVYRLIYDFGVIRRAEGLINSSLSPGEPKVNLLAGIHLQDLDARQLHGLFFAATRRHHPKLDLDDVDKLIRWDTDSLIVNALFAAYAQAMAPDAQERLKKILAGPIEDGGEGSRPSEGSKVGTSGSTTGQLPSSSSDSLSANSGG